LQVAGCGLNVAGCWRARTHQSPVTDSKFYSAASAALNQPESKPHQRCRALKPSANMTMTGNRQQATRRRAGCEGRSRGLG